MKSLALNTQNSLIEESLVKSIIEKLGTYANELKNPHRESPEYCIKLPFDEDNIKNVMEVTQRFRRNAKYVICIGIGGDSNGTKAAYDAIYGYYDVLEPQRFPKIIFLETVDEVYLNKTVKLLQAQKIKKEEVVFILASKSGTTTETLTNYNLLKDLIDWIDERLVIITSPQTPLWQKAKSQDITLLEIPSNISGRFSIFTGVGLLPLALANIDILKLLEGAMEGSDSDLAVVSTATVFLNVKKGHIINNLFVFHPRLESLAKCYRQFIGESLGKAENAIKPAVTVGTQDLHSVYQMFMGGYKNEFFTLVKTSEGKDKTLDAIYTAVKESFINKRIPFMELILEDFSEKTLGAFIQHKMLETLYLARLFSVNAFDQPDIEEYKRRLDPGSHFACPG